MAQAPAAAGRPARPTPPTRDPNTPGYVTAKLKNYLTAPLLFVFKAFYYRGNKFLRSKRLAE